MLQGENMEIKIYNSFTKKKEKFVPLEDNKVKMYACGITASGEAHIGHAIQAMIFDIVRRFFEKMGYDVLYARNYTDVDDKIIANANKINKDARLFAEEKIASIEKAMKDFKVESASMTLKATEHIDRIIEFVEKLIEKGYAYATERGDVYFAVDKFNGYGKLSNRNLEDARNGVRVDLEDNKLNPLDFALWKSAKPNEIYWDSPWGKGRPGWHIECSVMNYYNLGEQIDIHGGGRDLIFPHHENEIAQTESLTGKQFASYWMHNGLVKVDGQKMSKSLNNGILLKDLLEKYDAEIIRFALLQTNYKNDINITSNMFDNAKNQLLEFYKIMKQADEMQGNSENGKNDIIDNEFNEAMCDDFNTSKAISNLFGYFKTIKNKINRNDVSAKADVNQIRKTYELFELFKHEPSKFIAENEVKQEIPSNIKELAEKRWIAKQNRDFALADSLRNELTKLGFTIKDSKDGYEIQKI